MKKRILEEIIDKSVGQRLDLHEENSIKKTEVEDCSVDLEHEINKNNKKKHLNFQSSQSKCQIGRRGDVAGEKG